MPPSDQVPRIRRESRPEGHIGKFITEAGAEADNRVARAVPGPPPTEAEKAILQSSAHEPAQLFSRVLVTDLATGEQEAYRLVPEGEGDPLRGELSFTSPIGRALLMEYPGAVVAVKTPGGRRLYRLLRVEE